ncbi:MAG: DsbA family protein [Pseudomonadota bacterium]
MSDAIAFYYSITSRYAYLAHTQISWLEQETGVPVDWVPVDAVELRALADSEPFEGPPPSGQYRSPYRERDLADWVDFYAVPYREPPEANGELWWKGFEPERRRLMCLAALAGKEMGRGQEASRALFSLMFASDVWPIHRPEILDAVTALGLDRSELEARVGDPNTGKTLTQNAEAAVAAGAFGVPSFVWRGKMFFGNDRLPLLCHHIANSG